MYLNCTKSTDKKQVKIVTEYTVTLTQNQLQHHQITAKISVNA